MNVINAVVHKRCRHFSGKLPNKDFFFFSFSKTAGTPRGCKAH